MTAYDRAIIVKAEGLGARFKRDGKTRWMWVGGDYSYKTRLEAAYEYLEALHLNQSASTTADLNPKPE